MTDPHVASRAVHPQTALICRTLGCVGYAFAFDETGVLHFEWATGDIAGEEIVPLRALLAERAGIEAVPLLSHLRKLSAGNASEVDLNWRSDIATLRVRDSAQPEFDRFGRVIRIVGTVRDVSFDAWSVTAGSEGVWQRHMVERLDQGLACWDLDERLVFANRKFRELHRGVSSILRPGISARAFFSIVARSGEVAIEGLAALWARSALHDFRHEHVREQQLADGRWLEATPVRFAEGSILRIDDVTRQKASEQALRQAKEVAETANLKKSRFLRAANHDLRQPLATLKILIYSSFGVENEDKRHELLHSMDVTVGIMDEILGSLLQIGQLDAGRIATRVVHFQIGQVLDRLKIEFAPQAEAKGLRFKIVPSRSTVQTDRALLERILSNFIANAIRFTETGEILIGARRRGSTLEIQVWDSGCGIPDDQLALIFEEFHQVADQRTQQRGLGLGLNIAYRLAELLDHQIDVRSQLGSGSMFSVSVPVGSVWQSDLGEPEISERIGGEFLGAEVLVIEDNELLRNTVCLLLDRWGVKVTEASDGDKALALFDDPDSPRPDLALVDYRLPNGRAGTEVLADLRALLGYDLPGIVATADNDPALVGRIRSEGLPVLIKPINPARLRSAMHHLLYEQNRETER